MGWGNSDSAVAMATMMQPIIVMEMVIVMPGVGANRVQPITCSFGGVFTLESIDAIAGVGTGVE